MALVGDRLRQLRQRQGLTQDDVAQRAGIVLRMYQRYEMGDSDPSIEKAARIAEVLHTTLDYLAGISDDPSPRLIEEELTGDERDLIVAARQLDTDALFHIMGRLSVRKGGGT